MEQAKPTVVLVHGAFVDGAGWEGVYQILKSDGYDVRIVQNPTRSLADDVAATRRVIALKPNMRMLSGNVMKYFGLSPSASPTTNGLPGRSDLITPTTPPRL